MRGKLLFVAGIAVGYVLGARAGRERYEQIKEAADRVWNTPTVQKGVGQVKEFALARVGDVSDTVLDGAKKLINAATKPQPSTPAPRASAKPASSASTKPSTGTSTSAAAKKSSATGTKKASGSSSAS